MRTFRTVAIITAFTALCWGLLFAVLSAPGCAWAQDVDVGQSVAAGAEYDPEALTSKAFDAVAIGDWWGAASALVMLLTWAIRTGAFRRWPESRLAEMLEDPLVAYSLPIGLSALVVLVPAVLSGTPFTFSLLASTLVKVSGGSSMLFLGIKNAAERRALKAGATP